MSGRLGRLRALQLDAAPARKRIDVQIDALDAQTMVVNMGPQHPSTHGVLRIVLELDGEDWRPRALVERKVGLQKVLANAPAGIQYSEHLAGDGAAIFAHACSLGAEGIVSKHREHPYRSGPSKAWLKTKNPASPAVRREAEEDWR